MMFDAHQTLPPNSAGTLYFAANFVIQYNPDAAVGLVSYHHQEDCPPTRRLDSQPRSGDCPDYDFPLHPRTGLQDQQAHSDSASFLHLITVASQTTRPISMHRALFSRKHTPRLLSPSAPNGSTVPSRCLILWLPS
jgi:hypothetical protein